MDFAGFTGGFELGLRQMWQSRRGSVTL
jgi:hypothetical protein